MLYQRTLTVPANTPTDAPKETTIVIEHPYLWKIGVHFPGGCAGMVETAVFYGALQVWPSRQGEWASGDGITIWDEVHLEMPEDKTKLILKGCSPNTSYDHNVKFYFLAVEREIGAWMLVMSRLLEGISRMLRFLMGVR